MRARPLLRELPRHSFPEDPLAWVAALRPQAGRGLVFLDSAQRHAELGRYSFIAADPFHLLTAKDDAVRCDGERVAGDPFAAAQELLARYPLDSHPGLPPFQGGLAGWFGYDLNRHLERVPPPRDDDRPLPDMMLGAFDLIVAMDHEERRAFLFASGWPEREAASRQRRAEERLDWAAAILAAAPRFPDLTPPAPIAARAETAPDQFQAMVRRAKDYILAGDIYQANLSHRFQASLPPGSDALALYAQLRRHNPAPFGAFAVFDDVALLSTSPERFLRLGAGRVETRPIKGTRPRAADPAQDAALAAALMASAKDRAENLMIVDLLRNDLSRVCRLGSVRVPTLFRLESYAAVHHLVSVVTGELEPGQGALSLLRAAFPGGSITGAPKIRAMEIIAELEGEARGPYCGAIAWLGGDGAMDSNILIRTIAVANDALSFRVGCGIVADSDPEEEWAESLAKARALLDALAGRGKEGRG